MTLFVEMEMFFYILKSEIQKRFSSQIEWHLSYFFLKGKIEFLFDNFI